VSKHGRQHGSYRAWWGHARWMTAAAMLLATEAGAQQMSLPGNFAVNSNGAATYDIAIAVPPGTAGMVPSLKLSYSSQNGNGRLLLPRVVWHRQLLHRPVQGLPTLPARRADRRHHRRGRSRGHGAVVCAVTAAFLSTTAVSGIETGNFKLGLRAGLLAAATAVAFWEVGNMTNQIAGYDPYGQHVQPQFGTPAYDFNVVAHAAVGCASAMASGGKCGPSALAGGVTSAAGPLINGKGIFSLVANSALGGGTAVLGGGKFENGAITGAFGYLFNACGGPHGCAALFGSIGAAIGMVVSAGCDVGTGGVCALGNPAMVGASGAAGMATGAALDAQIDGVHGNSLDSQRQTYVYQLTDRDNGDVLKYGITSEANPFSRYTASEYDSMNADMQILESYPTRLMARVEELRLTGNYFIQNERFPPLTFRW
jgi:Possible hemagglutinin (DUF637)